MKAKNFKFVFVFMLFLLSTEVFSGGGSYVGNGGDHLRSEFLRTGNQILEFLKQAEAGKVLTQLHALDLTKLEATLAAEKIQVSDSALIDNSGSIVDALGEPGNITLSRIPWTRYFALRTDVAYLIFHEMLRSAGIDDDNYRISMALKPFKYFISTQASFPDVIQIGKGISINCGGKVQAVNFDSDRELVKLTFEGLEFSTRMESVLRPVVGFDSCTLNFSFKIAKGRRAGISMLDFKGSSQLPEGMRALLKSEIKINQHSDIANQKFSPNQAGQKFSSRAIFSPRYTDCQGGDLDIQIDLVSWFFSTPTVKKNPLLSVLPKIDLDEVQIYFQFHDCRN